MFEIAAPVSVLLAVGVLRDRRSFANAVLLGLALTLLALGTAGWLARTHSAAGRLVLLAVLVAVAVGPFILAAFLLVNGATMLRREGTRPTSLLPLLAGGGILAVLGFRVAVPLAGLSQLDLAGTIVVLLVCYVSFQCVSFVLYAYLYGRLRAPRNGDFVVVLGSGLLDGRVPPLLASRLERARAVYQALAASGRDPVLIVSGGKGSREQVSEAEAMAGYLVARGFPASQIRREDKSASTDENLARSKAIMDRLCPGATCVIVTSSYHVFRTAMTARRLGIRGQVTGARTARYYWPGATLREIGAVLLSHKVVNLTVCFLLAACPVLVSLLHHAASRGPLG